MTRADLLRAGRAWVAGRGALVGVAGAVLLLAGASWYQALIMPPYRFIDEQAHAGYVLALQGGDLPSIDTPIDQERGGPALRTRLATQPERRGHVWVANNPPYPYLVATGPSAVTRALGLPGGPLLGLRLVNLAGGAAAVALTYRLGRDLAGGDRTVGLVAAGLLAATPQVGFQSSVGFTDGVALLATTGVLSALARVLGAGTGPWRRRRVVELGLWCGAAAAVRPMALVLAAAAGAIALLVVVLRRQAPWRWTAAWLAAPAALLGGWHYALNLVRYGDPTGSGALMEKFLRQPSGTLWSNLTLWGAWNNQLRTISTRRIEIGLPSDSTLWFQLVIVVVAGSILVCAALASASRRPGLTRPRWLAAPPAIPASAWAAVALVSLLPFLLAAQHRTVGGGPHSRYLLPLVPAVAVAVALATVRVGTRWAGAFLVAALAVATYGQIRISARWFADNPNGPPGSELVTAYGNQLIRGAGLGVAALGLVALLVAIGRSTPATTVDRS